MAGAVIGAMICAYGVPDTSHSDRFRYGAQVELGQTSSLDVESWAEAIRRVRIDGQIPEGAEIRAIFARVGDEWQLVTFIAGD